MVSTQHLDIIQASWIPGHKTQSPTHFIISCSRNSDTGLQHSSDSELCAQAVDSPGSLLSCSYRLIPFHRSLSSIRPQPRFLPTTLHHSPFIPSSLTLPPLISSSVYPQPSSLDPHLIIVYPSTHILLSLNPHPSNPPSLHPSTFIPIPFHSFLDPHLHPSISSSFLPEITCNDWLVLAE